MTIDETKDELYRLLSDCVNNGYPIRNNTQKGRYRNAVKMAIASLKAWQEVRQKIGKLSLSWEYGQGVEDCLAIVDHYMQEVDDGK